MQPMESELMPTTVDRMLRIIEFVTIHLPTPSTKKREVHSSLGEEILVLAVRLIRAFGAMCSKCKALNHVDEAERPSYILADILQSGLTAGFLLETEPRAL
jgi:hypothetical protein